MISSPAKGFLAVYVISVGNLAEAFLVQSKLLQVFETIGSVPVHKA
jgi:hypothetical protein